MRFWFWNYNLGLDSSLVLMVEKDARHASLPLVLECLTRLSIRGFGNLDKQLLYLENR